MKTVVSKDGTKIAYDVAGSGPALIYITGAICHRNFWPIVSDFKFFSKVFTVYNYDRRGRGDSGDTHPYTIQKEVDDIEALIDAAGGKANLYGHSSGALLALEAALQLPTKVLKVLIYDPSNASGEKEKSDYAMTIQHVNDLLAKQKNADALRYFLTQIGMPKFFVFMMRFMPGWTQMKTLAPTLAYDMKLTADITRQDRLSKINVPVKIGFGEKSPTSLKEVSKQVHKAISNSELFEAKKQDHMVPAKVILPVMKDFFSK